MKLFTQTEDLIVMGVQVTSFPNGIKEAFDCLMKTLGPDRAYYGVSWMDETDKVKYYAMAREAFPGEAERYHYELLKIEKGEYQAEVVQDWLNKTDCIKDVFHNLMSTRKPDQNHPCIEWYTSDQEMTCMVKL